MCRRLAQWRFFWFNKMSATRVDLGDVNAINLIFEKQCWPKNNECKDTNAFMHAGWILSVAPQDWDVRVWNPTAWPTFKKKMSKWKSYWIKTNEPPCLDFFFKSNDRERLFLFIFICKASTSWEFKWGTRSRSSQCISLPEPMGS